MWIDMYASDQPMSVIPHHISAAFSFPQSAIGFGATWKNIDYEFVMQDRITILCSVSALVVWWKEIVASVYTSPCTLPKNKRNLNCVQTLLMQ